ncbi:hypothetical protein N9051_01050 [Akkermansiaceae bacterium]|nr:hypothetical protein [Akkermansiaceae bacterium]
MKFSIASVLTLSVLSLYGDQLQLGNLRINQIQQGNLQANQEIIDLPESDASGTDIIRFNNGDLLHGEFVRLGDRVVWSRPDLERDIDFKINNVRQVIFDGGRSNQGSPTQAHVALINGDQIPGEIISLDDQELVLKSPFAGELKIARDKIVSLTPNPFDGKLNYAGPFTSDGWVMIESKNPEGVRKRQVDKEEAAAEDSEEPKETEEKKPTPSWLYSGASFYSTNVQPIAFDAKLPDVGRLKFKASWKNRLQFNVVFHADFTRPLPREAIIPDKLEGEPKPESAADGLEEAIEEDQTNEEEPPEENKLEYKPLEYESLFDQIKGKQFQAHDWLKTDGVIQIAQAYGSAYVLSIYGQYPTLNRCTFDTEGNMKTSSTRATRINSNLQTEGEAEFEIRFNRPKNQVYLYVDGEYAFQWNDIEGYAGKGGGLAFAATSNCKLKVSDIIATSWSGNIDPARSFSNDERDIALLTNGTDRFSGQLTKIANGKAHFKGAFSEMTIPLEELSEIHFKSDAHASLEKLKWGDQIGRVIFNPIGRLTLSPKNSKDKNLRGESPILGEVKVDLTSAILLDFADGTDVLNEWITDF